MVSEVQRLSANSEETAGQTLPGAIDIRSTHTSGQTAQTSALIASAPPPEMAQSIVPTADPESLPAKQQALYQTMLQDKNQKLSDIMTREGVSPTGQATIIALAAISESRQGGVPVEELVAQAMETVRELDSQLKGALTRLTPEDLKAILEVAGLLGSVVVAKSDGRTVTLEPNPFGPERLVAVAEGLAERVSTEYASRPEPILPAELARRNALVENYNRALEGMAGEKPLEELKLHPVIVGLVGKIGEDVNQGRLPPTEDLRNYLVSLVSSGEWPPLTDRQLVSFDNFLKTLYPDPPLAPGQLPSPGTQAQISVVLAGYNQRWLEVYREKVARGNVSYPGNLSVSMEAAVGDEGAGAIFKTEYTFNLPGNRLAVTYGSFSPGISPGVVDGAIGFKTSVWHHSPWPGAEFQFGPGFEVGVNSNPDQPTTLSLAATAVGVFQQSFFDDRAYLKAGYKVGFGPVINTSNGATNLDAADIGTLGVGVNLGNWRVALEYLTDFSESHATSLSVGVTF